MFSKPTCIVLKFLLVFSLLFFQSEIFAQTDDEQEKSESNEKTFILEPIEVEGEKGRNIIEKPLSESAGLNLSTTIVNESEIERQGAETVIDALKYVPGAWIETRGRKVKQFFSVRGQKYPYPGYAIDGTWQREFHETPYFFSSSDIERIEVIRSSAALLKGPSSLAGIVNIVPKQYRVAGTSAEIKYGTFDTYRFHLSHGATSGKISYAIGLGSHHTDGPEGRKAAEDMTNFRGSLYWYPSEKLLLKTNFYHLYGKRELARAEKPASSRFREGVEKFDPFQSSIASLDTFYRINENASTELLLHYADRENNFVTISEEDSIYQSTLERDYEWGMNLIQTLSFLRNNVLRIGGLYNHWIAPNGKRFYVGNRCDLETISAVIVDEHKIGPLNVDAGLRLTKTYINEYAKVHDAFDINGSPNTFKKIEPILDEWEPSILNGSIGAAYYLSRLFSLHLHLSAGQIPPREGSLDVNQKEPKNEKRVKLDAGAQFTREKLGQISVVTFYTQQKDAIVFSGKTQEAEGNRIIELYMNRDQDQIGLEIEGRSAFLFNIAQIFVNATAMKSRAESEGEMVHNEELPQFIMNGGIYVSKSKLDLNILGKFVSSYESTRFVPSDKGAQPLGDFFALDMSMGWALDKQENTKLNLEIRNITDEKFSTVVGYPDYGRRFTISLQRKFR